MLVLTQYIRAAMRNAQYEIIEDDGSIFATIPGFDGLWANAPTRAETDAALESGLEGWLLVGLAHDQSLPVIDGIDLTVCEVA